MFLMPEVFGLFEKQGYSRGPQTLKYMQNPKANQNTGSLQITIPKGVDKWGMMQGGKENSVSHARVSQQSIDDLQILGDN